MIAQFLEKYGGLIKAVLVAALLALAFAAGWAVRGWRADAVDSKAVAVQAKGELAGVQRARGQEHKAAASDAAASAQYQKGIQDGKNELQASLDQLGASLRLRKQQLAAAKRLCATQPSACGRDDQAGADFLDAHAADAERLASEADEVVKQLSACQAIVVSDRQATVGP